MLYSLRRALKPLLSLLVLPVVPLLRRKVAALAVAALTLAAPAAATWSIVVVNTRTGEVGIFAATCVRNLDLERYLGMIRVGEGAAAVQFQGDPTGSVRRFIWAGMEQGQSPEQIMQGIESTYSNFQGLQIGIASTFGPAQTHTGTGVWDPNAGVQGQVGDLRYAIQGNVIAGSPVVLEAEAALLGTEGDLITRLSAAMEISRIMGGDGRCSCSDSSPGACGSPPNVSFNKASDVGFLIVARMGDVDGVCFNNPNCTNGTYYFQNRVTGGGDNAPDPVTKLLRRVSLWEEGLAGVTDHLRTEVTADRGELVADGQAATTVTVRLVDRRGVPLGVGGQTLTVEPMHAGAVPATVGPVVDNGDGTHTFELRATAAAGSGEWHLRVDDGVREVLLWPALRMNTAPLVDLHGSRSELSGQHASDLVLTLNRAGDAGRGYRILGSTSGQVPGTTLQGAFVPLNPDRLFGLTLGSLRGPVFGGFSGTLDAGGRAEARLTLTPSLAAVLVGTRFDFCALVDTAAGAEATGVASVLVTP